MPLRGLPLLRGQLPSAFAAALGSRRQSLGEIGGDGSLQDLLQWHTVLFRDRAAVLILRSIVDYFAVEYSYLDPDLSPLGLCRGKATDKRLLLLFVIAEAECRCLSEDQLL